MMKQEIVIEQKWVTISEFNKVRAGQQLDAAFVWPSPQAPHIAAPLCRPPPRLSLHRRPAHVASHLTRRVSAPQPRARGGPGAQVFAVYQALPGPEATEIASYFGLVSKGRLGGLLTGLGFILPGEAAPHTASTVFVRASPWHPLF